MYLKDKNVLITGAGNAIGKATAVLFANRSANLILVDQSIDRLEEMKTMGQILGKCQSFPCDFNRLDSIKETYQNIISSVKTIDYLINNVNVGSWKKFNEMSDSEIIEILHNNSTGTILFTHFVLLDMIKKNSGKIVNLSSLYAKVPSPNISVYAASKAALISFGNSLRMELENTAIDVINVIASPLDKDFASHTDQIRELHMGDENQIAEIILKACSKNKSQITAGTYTDVLLGVNSFMPSLSRSITRQMAKLDVNS